MTFYLICSQGHYRFAVMVTVTIVQRKIVTPASTRMLAYTQVALTAPLDMCVAAGTVKFMF